MAKVIIGVVPTSCRPRSRSSTDTKSSWALVGSGLIIEGGYVYMAQAGYTAMRTQVGQEAAMGRSSI